MFESCKARFVYSYIILPRIETLRSKDIAKTGKLFHKIAETNTDYYLTKAILLNEKRSIRDDITQFVELLQSRDYFSLFSENEVFIKMKFLNFGFLSGIIDRLIRTDDEIIIVDYKTSALSDPKTDFKQLKIYAFILSSIENLSGKKIKLILDYIRVNEVYYDEFTFEDYDLYEDYLLLTYEEIIKLEREFLKLKNIKDITHTVGDCSFCPMLGRCAAYQITINLDADLDNIKSTTESLAEELKIKNAQLKILEKRCEVLKDALLYRHNEGDELVKTYGSIIKSASTFYPADKVLDKILPVLIETALKDVKYKSILNIPKIVEAIKDVFLRMLDENLRPKDIPSKFLTNVQNFIIKVPKKPYIRLKGEPK